MGRLTRDPNVKYSQGSNSMAVARFTLAVDRKGRKQEDGSDQQTADFISCVCFSKLAEVAENYLRQGTKIAIVGRILTGSYTNRDGQKVYTTEVAVDEMEFAESKTKESTMSTSTGGDGFKNIPEGIEEELPFH